MVSIDPVAKAREMQNRSTAKQQAEKSAQYQTLARIEQQAPGITADLAALSTVFGKFAHIRITAGPETLEIKRQPIPGHSPINDERRQAEIAAGLGSNAWRKHEVIN